MQKGLRHRNSPTCTLSQNGYGVYEASHAPQLVGGGNAFPRPIAKRSDTHPANPPGSPRAMGPYNNPQGGLERVSDADSYV